MGYRRSCPSDEALDDIEEQTNTRMIANVSEVPVQPLSCSSGGAEAAFRPGGKGPPPAI